MRRIVFSGMVVLALAAAVACSTETTYILQPAPAAAVDAGVEEEPDPADAGGSSSTEPSVDAGVEAGAGGTNPEGIPYPTSNIGFTARKGTTPGQRIGNFTFQGYPDGDKSNGLQTVSLAQFYDPLHKRHRIIHIMSAALWSIYDQQQAKVAAPMAATFAAKEAVWLIAISEGSTVGAPATKANLDSWMSSFKVPCTHVLDPGSEQLGPFFDVAATPWNGNIDARTMEILTSGTGALTSTQAIEDDLDDALALAASSKL